MSSGPSTFENGTKVPASRAAGRVTPRIAASLSLVTAPSDLTNGPQR
jgi:hypothetical protein